MSHTANLRNRSRPSLPESAAKRRRISDSLHPPATNASDALTNGDLVSKKLAAVPTHSAKVPRNVVNDTSNVVVGHGDEPSGVHRAEAATSVVQVDDHNDQNDRNMDRDSESDDDDDDALDGPGLDSSNKMVSARDAADVEEELEKDSSFGDLLRARNLDVVTVDASSAGPDATEKALAASSSNQTLTVPNATSLGTVLTQALRTNDVDLLESCLQIPSLESIRATVQRLHSSLATTLLQRLAERLHKRPGRAGSLMVWVQWTIVAHGGYLATQPAAMQQIHTLYQVVKQRAAGLQPLLSLKGRLDMLEAQMQMRRNLQQASRAGAARDEDNAAVIYVEGEEEEDSNVAAMEGTVHDAHQLNRTKKAASYPEIQDSEGEDADMPMAFTNGIEDSDEDEEIAEDSSEEQDALIDDEAEESAEDSDALSEDVDFDDVDEDEAEESSEGEGEEGLSKRPKAFQKDSTRRKQGF